MRNSLLQKVGDAPDKPSSMRGAAVIFYFISLLVAFLAGIYFERLKVPPSMEGTDKAPPSETEASETPATGSAGMVATGTPSASPSPTAAKPFTPPTLISQTESSSTPVRVEKALPVVASSPTAVVPSMAPSPAAHPGDVTVTEAIEIPVKQGDKVVGYINLRPGQQITPVSVDNGQIKVKCGENFVYVPVKSTDMPH